MIKQINAFLEIAKVDSCKLLIFEFKFTNEILLMFCVNLMLRLARAR